MLKNYFKSALRSFKKNKTVTFINVLGLSIGISASLIIFMIVEFEYSFDRYQPDANRIYRVVSEGEGWKSSNVPVPVHTTVQQKVTGIQTTSLFLQYNDRNARVLVPQDNDKSPKVFKSQRQIVFADSNYFSIFPQKWIYGNANSSLQNPYQLVLTESLAQRYFPNVPFSALPGRTVIISDTIRTTISGIIQDLKANSDFKYDAFISLSTISQTTLKLDYNWDDWTSTNSNTQTFVKLLPNAKTINVNSQLTAIFSEHANAGNEKNIMRLQPLNDIHIDGKGKASTIRNLALLAIFLLLLGAINFINLSTAHAAERAKEIGIRKTLGSKKTQLILQFISETFLITLLTSIVSVAITPLLLNAFSGFTPDGLNFNYFLSQPVVWGFLMLLVLIVSVAAGLYPAFVLTRFNPISVLKNTVVAAAGTTRAAFLRKTLIIFQFIIAQVFIVAVLIVGKQIRFAEEKNMGFRKDAIINFNVPPGNKKNILLDELKKISEIQNISLGSRAPAFDGRMTTNIKFNEKANDIQLEVDSRNGDTSFLNVYGITLIAGRNISYPDTANELLINETLAKQLGFANPAGAIDHFITIGNSPLPIVGVMKDFDLASVRTAIKPMVYYADLKFCNVMHVALQRNPSTWSDAIRKMHAAYNNIYLDADFNYTFLDETISDFYRADRKLSKLLTWSAGIAILISCLGLLGLVIFMTNNRMKEIGVRKILGATVRQIITLLSVDFVKLLLIAFVIAIPVAWGQTNSWLQNFAYRTTLSWWIFLLSGIIMMAIALIILCVRAGKAAMENPVKSLRPE